MARRKHSDDEELPFVALMDTMTNVVGVLLIVLVMVGLGVSTTVKRVLDALPPVTPEQLAQLEKEMEEHPPAPMTPEEVQKKIEAAEAKIKELTAELLKTVDLTKDRQDVKVIDLAELRRKIEGAKFDRDKAKRELDALFAEVDKLKKALDDTPEVKLPPPQYVRIPNPRPLPPNSKREAFLVAKGRLIYLNEQSFLDIIQREIVKNREQLLSPGHPKITSTTPPASIKYNKDKMLSWFERAKVGDRTLQAKLAAVSTAAVFNIDLQPQPNAGESAAELRNPASFFQRFLRKIKTEPGKVVWLYVFKDSIETYLTAREVADATGVPVGWQIYSQDFYSMRLPAISYEPFTPPKIVPNGAPLVLEIKPPKEQLD